MKEIIKPIRYILKKDNYLFIQDKEFNFEDEIQVQHNIYDLKDDKDYHPRSWSDSKFLNLFRKNIPKAFTFYNRKIKLKKMIEERYKIKIEEIINDAGISFLEIRYNISNLSTNEILNRYIRSGTDLSRAILQITWERYKRFQN